MLVLGLCFFLCLLSTAFVAAENRFRQPPGPGLAYDYRDNNVYTMGENRDRHWDMDYDSARLILWQESVGGGSTLTTSISQSMNSEVSTKDFPNPKLSNLYFFELLGPGREPANWGVRCHYFNITEAPVTPQPSNTTVATPLSSTKDEGLPTGAAAGIAVGVTFAAVLQLDGFCGLEGKLGGAQPHKTRSTALKGVMNNSISMLCLFNGSQNCQ
ncbi:hypothetical protein CSAL01_04053 [Colletotrichum salicis]|uniref:Uncharacterized protein n=1 Tax=Colletotrichum salicis TaxID=1209931 RepID=A0A135V859_9PEZI|nr:hypothetical protein CSAL01_04053 [Colletotrichum salicis]